MNWEKESTLLIDFEKSYDRIEWNFIFMLIEGLRFQVRYLGISSTISSNIKEMWNWIKEEIDKKFKKWNKQFLLADII